MIIFDQDGQAKLLKLISDNQYDKIIVLTDDNTRKYCFPLIKKILPDSINISIKPGESYKTIETVQNIWNQLLDMDAGRNTLFINLGGGIITDIGGFTAATFKRGMPFIHIPTSLLGMVDAAIGGKNGINYKGIKNQIGTIIQPEMIWINTLFLNTLPQEEFDSGFAEMLKHGLIADRNYWNELSKYKDDENRAGLLELNKKSVDIKSEIVQKDPKEQSLRKVLNFGHTLGHAIESYLQSVKKPLSHGHAIAIGMVLAAFFSNQLTEFPEKDTLTVKKVLNRKFPVVKFKRTDIEQIIQLLKFDKKNKNGKILYVLLEKIGKPVINQQVPEQLIYQAFDYYSELNLD